MITATTVPAPFRSLCIMRDCWMRLCLRATFVIMGDAVVAVGSRFIRAMGTVLPLLRACVSIQRICATVATLDRAGVGMAGTHVDSLPASESGGGPLVSATRRGETASR